MCFMILITKKTKTKIHNKVEMRLTVASILFIKLSLSCATVVVLTSELNWSVEGFNCRILVINDIADLEDNAGLTLISQERYILLKEKYLLDHSSSELATRSSFSIYELWHGLQRIYREGIFCSVAYQYPNYEYLINKLCFQLFKVKMWCMV